MRAWAVADREKLWVEGAIFLSETSAKHKAETWGAEFRAVPVEVRPLIGSALGAGLGVSAEDLAAAMPAPPVGVPSAVVQRPRVEPTGEEVVVLAKLIRLLRWREGFRGSPPVPQGRTEEAKAILAELDSYADRVLGS